MIRAKLPPRPTREERLNALMTTTVQPVARAVMATADSIATGRAAEQAPKLPREVRTVQAIRDAARDEPCTLRIPSVCTGDPATSVWAHWPGIDGDRGMGLKALDLAGAIACAACHDVLDMRAKAPAGYSRQQIELDFLHGHMRSLVVLARKGIL
jgi:hypothetical protein